MYDPIAVKIPARMAVAVAALAGALAAEAAAAAAQAPQNPSPMVETTRAHDRVADVPVPGTRLVVDGVLPVPVHVFVPAGAELRSARLLVHFHGATYVAEHAVAETNRVVAVVNAGSGARVYEEALAGSGTFTRLVDAIERAVLPEGEVFRDIVLSGFSAGYGSIRAILREGTARDRLAGVMLLDGLHTSYVPDGLVLHRGGELDTSLLEPFAELARTAAAGRARLLITHSEIFPGTFASTTESTDHLLAAVGLRRTAVLDWGPVGMQLLGRACRGRLAILGFAGNTAPDHVDHLHGMRSFLELLDRLGHDPAVCGTGEESGRS